MIVRIFAIALGLLSAFLLRSALEVWGPHTEVIEEASVHEVRRYDDDQISRVLLIDSVLTILGNYYVHPEKARMPQLFFQTLETLKREGWLDYQKNPRNIEVRTRGRVKQWELRADEDNEVYAYQLLELAELLSDASHNGEDFGIEVDQKMSMVMNAMLASLDPHSAVLNKEDYRDLQQGTEGVFGGLGVLVGVQDGQLTVIKPLPNSPASRANVQKFDRILSIDGVSTFGYELDDLVTHMRGLPGSKVKVRLLKKGGKAPEWVTMTREMIQVDAVTSKVVFSKEKAPVLVLKVESFSNHTVAQARSALFNFHKEFGRDKGVVLDLRGNPGGLLDQAVRLSDLFLGHGLIVSTRGRLVESEFSRTEFGEEDFPVAVLIDGESASASEIVAAALQDRERAVVIGQTSFGKGSVQTIFELPDGQALKLTIARYYTPKDKSLQNHGVDPDIYMQPVFQDDENRNLLGLGRYRKESFLQRFSMKNQDLSWKNHQVHYYLMNREETGEYGQRHYDHELEFAVAWVEGQPEAQKELQKWTNESVEFLSSLGVDWATAGCPADALELKTVHMPTQVSYATHLHIPFQLQNKTSQSCDQVSIFMHGDDPRLEPVELLIGKLKPGQVHTGELKAWVPGWMDLGQMSFSMGIAVASHQYGDYLHKQIQVVGRELGSVDHKVFFEDPMGRVQGYLEDHEEASVEVVVTNTSDYRVEGLNSQLFNLSGGQIEVRLDPAAYDFSLRPGETKTLKHKLKARNLQTDNVTLGVMIRSDHILKPVTQEFVVNALVKTSSARRTNGGVH